MENINKLENRLWEAADQLRANSKLTSSEYSMPVLGLIFLRHAFNRFQKAEREIKQNQPVSTRAGSSAAAVIDKSHFLGKRALFLPEKSRYDYLVTTTEDKGEAVINAMNLIEAENSELLQGVLPKDFRIFESDVLKKLLKIFNDDALSNTDGDIFGQIYEYFLMKFAMEGAQDKGEFFTPVSLVQMIVNVIEPNHGNVLDPACGSGGMFVQTSHFLENEGKEATGTVTFYGQEKTETTIKLAKMNLAVHNLEGQIANANSFYVDHHNLVGKADFVMANPPFNVDGVDADRIKNDVRLPFGLPGVNKKSGAVGNGNYLWISYFYSYLNDSGRAGFVMSSQASRSGHGEKDVRQSLVQTGHADVMVSIRSNFFYTRTVPCELWFLDKGKPEAMREKVLMLDARNVYRKVNRKVYDFTPEQLKNLTSIIWLYRGQNERFLKLVHSYLQTVLTESAGIEAKLKEFDEKQTALSDVLKRLAPEVEPKQKSFFEKEDQTDEEQSYLEKAELFLSTLNELKEAEGFYKSDSSVLLKEIAEYQSKYNAVSQSDNAAQHEAQEAFAPIAENIKSLIKQIDLLAKLTVRAVDLAEKELKAKDGDGWDKSAVFKLKKELRTDAKDDDETQIRKRIIEQLKLASYFHKQAAWLQTRFPEAKLADVEGLVKLVDVQDIIANDWSLTPGRYVGVAAIEEDDEFDFEETMQGLHLELADLNAEAVNLAETIQTNFVGLGV